MAGAHKLTSVPSVYRVLITQEAACEAGIINDDALFPVVSKVLTSR